MRRFGFGRTHDKSPSLWRLGLQSPHTWLAHLWSTNGSPQRFDVTHSGGNPKRPTPATHAGTFN